MNEDGIAVYDERDGLVIKKLRYMATNESGGHPKTVEHAGRR